ncbi:MAG: hypothetical protein JNK82_33345 [Myxococcaceae bacterium]|nr:hypothetical protein [Myxococcaceae bacterium]
MIALRKSKAFLAVVRGPELPQVDVARIALKPRGIKLGPGAIEGGERVWRLDPATGRLWGGLPVHYGGVTIAGATGPEHVLFVSGPGGWVQVTIGQGFRSVVPAPPRLDGEAIGFSESGFVCREPAIIGYRKVVLTIRHPVGGAERRLELPVDVVSGTFETSAYLGLSAGDRVRLEVLGAGEPLVRSFVFPKAPDRWHTYSLEALVGQAMNVRSAG